MPIAAPLIIGGATLGSALIGSRAAKAASNAQMQAAARQENFARENVGFQREILDINRGIYDQNQGLYDQGRASLAPWINTGAGAMSSLGGLYGLPGSSNPNGNLNWGQFLNSPDYQWSLQQGMRALDMSQASKGLLQSGGTIRGAQNYGQGLASQQFGNYFQRMLSLAGLGQTAAATSAGLTSSQAGTNASLAGANVGVGGNISSAYGQQANAAGNFGQAQASGYVGSANAITGALGSGVNNLMLYSALNRGAGGQGGMPMSLTPPVIGAPNLGNAGGTGGFFGGLA